MTMYAFRQGPRRPSDLGLSPVLVVAAAILFGGQGCNRSDPETGPAVDAGAGGDQGGATGGAQVTGGTGGTSAGVVGGSMASAGATASEAASIGHDAAAPDVNSSAGGQGGMGGNAGGARPDAATNAGAGASGTVASSTRTGGTGGTKVPGSTGWVAEPLWPDVAGTLNLPECGDGGVATSPLRVNPATPVDYIAFCQVLAFSPKRDGGIDTNYQVLEQSGTPCKGSADASACAARVSAAANTITTSEQCGGPPYSCQHFVVTTAGDTVRVYLPSEYRTLLGTIDTADEARLLTNQMTFRGWQVESCGSVRASANGFDVVGVRLENDCNPILRMRDLLHVDSTGTITVVRSNVASVMTACI
jgi:hypothetical protein